MHRQLAASCKYFIAPGHIMLLSFGTCITGLAAIRPAAVAAARPYVLHVRPAWLLLAELCCIPTAAADEAEESEEEWEEAGDSEEEEDSEQQPAMGALVPLPPPPPLPLLLRHVSAIPGPEAHTLTHSRGPAAPHPCLSSAQARLAARCGAL